MSSSKSKKPFAHQKTRYFLQEKETSSDPAPEGKSSSAKKTPPTRVSPPTYKLKYISRDMIFSVFLGAAMICILLGFYFYSESIPFYENIIKLILP